MPSKVHVTALALQLEAEVKAKISLDVAVPEFRQTQARDEVVALDQHWSGLPDSNR